MVELLAWKQLMLFPYSFRYFDCVDVCRVRTSWNEVRVEGVLQPFACKDNLPVRRIKVESTTEIEFTLFQEGQRYLFMSYLPKLYCLVTSFFFDRNSTKAQRMQLDLCVVVFREENGRENERWVRFGSLAVHSRRMVRGFVGCNAVLEQGTYLVVCLAFNHWNTSKSWMVWWRANDISIALCFGSAHRHPQSKIRISHPQFEAPSVCP